MTTHIELREIEQALNFTYPPAFLSAIEELGRAFCNGVLLLSLVDIDAVREDIPDRLLPFLRDHNGQWPDIYAFDLDSQYLELRVVVWCDHAIVMDWNTFADFLRYVRSCP